MCICLHTHDATAILRLLYRPTFLLNCSSGALFMQWGLMANTVLYTLTNNSPYPRYNQ